MSEALGAALQDVVTVRFEACVAFEADGSASAVCAACGWLEHEHDFGGPETRADVRVLPRRKRPTRLAS